jgi:hypothetical protein
VKRRARAREQMALACGLNRRRRRRIRHGTELVEKETEEEAKWDASRDFSAIKENIGTSL